MGFISSLARSKLGTIFKHPLAQSSNLYKHSNFSGSTFKVQALLFCRPHKRVHFSTSNHKLTPLRFYHENGSNRGGFGYFVEEKLAPWFKRVHRRVVIGCVLACVYVGSWETVPYTNRNHFVASTDWATKLAFDKLKAEFKSHILDQHHPTSKRVIRITENLLTALHDNLELGPVILSYASDSEPVDKEKLKREEKSWFQRRREMKAGKYHLDGMHWEVMVIDLPVDYAFSILTGKIVVFTGLLKVCITDDELATVIGHEVGHVVARHTSEKMMLGFLYVTLIIFAWRFLAIVIYFFNEWIIEKRKALVDYPLSRRNEGEADQIGMMVMASAGYDPRKAPNVYRKLDSSKDDPSSTHPSGEKRAEMLNKGSLMQEAVAIYKQRSSYQK